MLAGTGILGIGLWLLVSVCTICVYQRIMHGIIQILQKFVRIPVPASMQAPEREWGSAMNPRIKYFAPSQRSTILQIRAASAIQDKTSTATRVKNMPAHMAKSMKFSSRSNNYHEMSQHFKSTRRLNMKQLAKIIFAVQFIR